jgi:hypothetical protein
MNEVKDIITRAMIVLIIIFFMSLILGWCSCGSITEPENVVYVDEKIPLKSNMAIANITINRIDDNIDIIWFGVQKVYESGINCPIEKDMEIVFEIDRTDLDGHNREYIVLIKWKDYKWYIEYWL